MSVLIPGTDTFPANVTAPAILDPANGAEIATMGTHLAQRTFYLAKFHLHRYVAVALDDLAYPTEHAIVVVGSWVTIVTTPSITMSFTAGDVLTGDIVEISSSFNYDTTGVALLEIRHLSDVDPVIIGRRRLPVGSGLSATYTSFHVVLADGSVDYDTQVRINAGSIDIQRPISVFARLMKETT